MTKNMKYIILAFIACAVIFGLKKCFDAFKKADKKIAEAKRTELPNTLVLPDDYRSIFKTSYIDSVHVKIIKNSKVRNPIAIAIFNDEFDLIITKYDLSVDQIMNKIVAISTGNPVKKQNDQVYNTIIDNDFTYNYWKVPKIRSIYVNVDGDVGMPLHRSDSLIEYSQKLSELSLQFDDQESYDLLFQPANSRLTNFMFLKKRGSLFFLIGVPKINGVKNSRRSLYDLVN